MATTTPEGWRYPVLADGFQRIHIQNLAADMEASLRRIRSQVKAALAPPRATVTRPAAQTIAINTLTPLSFTSVGQNALLWDAATPAVLTAPEDGLYWFDVATRVATAPPAISYVVLRAETLPTAVWAGRSWGAPLGTAATQYGLSGMIYLTAGQQWQAQLMWQGTAGTATFGPHRMSCALVARCARPLTANPYFETDVAPWTVLGGTLLHSTAAAHERTGAALLTPDGGSAVVSARTERVAVAGGTHRMRAWVRCAAARNVRTSILWLDGAGGLVSRVDATAAVPAGGWTHVLVSGAAPPTTVQAQGVVEMDATPPASHTLYIDDAWLAAACS